MASGRTTIETRYDQMFPTHDPAEIDRLRHFGETRTYDAGERLAAAGDVSAGMFVILRGEVGISQHSALGRDEAIVTYGPGSFIGEIAQLSGRPSLVDAHATKRVDALVIPSRRLRDVLVAEAEVGERIMRALILRRVGLIESGISGPVIVGRSDDANVLRLAGFLARNGHPHQRLDPDADPGAKALIERFHVERSALPIVLCPTGHMLRNPSEVELAGCLGLVPRIDPTKVYDVAIVGAGPAGLAAAVYGASEGLNTSWLSGSGVALDAKGFVRTGADVTAGRRALETSRDGVFAIGDVRSGSTKRVAAAVGEGAQVIATIHAFLADAGERLGDTADDGR